LNKSIPPKINATCKKIVVTIIAWPTTDKELEYFEFAELFGMTQQQAREAELAAAAVRIQAMSRGKQGNAIALERHRQRLEKEPVGAYTKTL